MGDTENTKKKSFWEGLKTEYSKIVFPNTETVMKQALAVCACSVAIGLIIAGLDALIVFGLHFII